MSKLYFNVTKRWRKVKKKSFFSLFSCFDLCSHTVSVSFISFNFSLDYIIIKGTKSTIK